MQTGDGVTSVITLIVPWAHWSHGESLESGPAGSLHVGLHGTEPRVSGRGEPDSATAAPLAAFQTHREHRLNQPTTTAENSDYRRNKPLWPHAATGRELPGARSRVKEPIVWTHRDHSHEWKRPHTLGLLTAWGEQFNMFELQFPHLQNGSDSVFSCGFWWGWMKSCLRKEPQCSAWPVTETRVEAGVGTVVVMLFAAIQRRAIGPGSSNKRQICYWSLS